MYIDKSAHRYAYIYGKSREKRRARRAPVRFPGFELRMEYRYLIEFSLLFRRRFFGPKKVAYPRTDKVITASLSLVRLPTFFSRSTFPPAILYIFFEPRAIPNSYLLVSSPSLFARHSFAITFYSRVCAPDRPLALFAPSFLHPIVFVLVFYFIFHFFS